MEILKNHNLTLTNESKSSDDSKLDTSAIIRTIASRKRDKALNIVFYNGQLHREWSDPINTPPGFFVETLKSLIKKKSHLKKEIESYCDKNSDYWHTAFTALETRAFYLDEKVHLPEPLHLIHIYDGKVREANSQYLFYLEPNSQLDLMETCILSGDVSQQYSHHLTILREGSQCRHQKTTENLNGISQIFNRSWCEQYAHSNYQYLETILNKSNNQSAAGVYTSDARYRLRESQTNCDLSGMILAPDYSKTHQYLEIEHLSPETFSSQEFYNILLDKGEVSFTGKVFVKKNASGSNSEQLNKSLLLSPEAHFYSRPQLSIFNDDVKCAHGSTSGELSADELFYLQSRGLKKAQARFLLLKAFFLNLLQTSNAVIDEENLNKMLDVYFPSGL